ncbi:MAG: FAD synthetase family protein [Treponema sp.]|nr:FAD synthetase family protein [Treponema sp.]
MQIIEWHEFLAKPLPLNGKHSAMTVGVFDGLHRGHRDLIQRAVARGDHSVPVVVTFKQSHHKKSQDSGREYLGEILTFRQKMAGFEILGIAITIVIEFSESFRRMAGADFLRILQEQGNMSFLAVGSNFRCGYRLDTDALAIQHINARRNIPTAIVPLLTEGSAQISSSQIRAAISRGDLKAAAAMLGYPFTVDLAGAAPVCASSGRTSCGISGQGRILPPPGRYAVNLLEGKGGGGQKKQAEILVEDGNIIIEGNTAGESHCFEYAEFLPA